MQATEDPRFKTPELCLDLGGELQDADDRQVCSGVDANDTFCIVNSADALPCRGLYKHVIRCNAQYNRPALNPFFCGPPCDPQKARGPACERVVPLDDVVAVRRVEYNLAKGFSGAAHTISVGQNHTLSLPENPQYSGFTLNAVEQTDHWEIEITPPLGAATLTASVAAKISCAGCFPASLTIVAVFSPLPSPAVPLDNIVAVRRVEYNLAEGFSGAAHTISVGQNYTLSFPENPQYSGFTLNAVDETDHWEIEITPPLGAATLTASIAAKISCAECMPASVTIVAVFSPFTPPALPLDDVVAVRRVEYLVAPVFSGAVHTISVGQNYTLSFPQNPQYNRFALNAVDNTDHWEIEITPRLGMTALTASIVAEVSCAGCMPASLTIIAVFSPFIFDVPRFFPPLLSEVRFDSTDPRAMGADIYDFKQANTAYANMRFQQVAGPAEIETLTDGRVRTRTGERILGGKRELVAARIRPIPGLRLPEATLTLHVLVDFSPAEQAAHLPQKNATVFAAPDYAGAVHTLALAPEAPVIFRHVFDASPGWALDPETGAVSLLAPPSESGAQGSFLLGLSRPGTVGVFSYRVTASVFVRTLTAPPQFRLTVTIGADGTASALPHQMRFPPGFAAADFTVDILEVGDGGNPDSFTFTNGQIIAGANPPRGEYQLSLGIQHPGFLGTLRTSLPVLAGSFGGVSQGIPSAQRAFSVTVAPSFTGEFHRVNPVNPSVRLLPPPPPPGFAFVTVGQPSNLRHVALHLTASLGSSGGAVITATIAQLLNEVFQNATVAVFQNATVAVSLTALAAPPPALASVVAALTSRGKAVATLKLPGFDVADLTFNEVADDEDLFYFGDVAGEIRLQEAPAAGSYGLTTAIWSANRAFLGTVYYPLRLEVYDSSILPPPDPTTPLEILLSFVQFNAAAGFAGTLTVFSPPDPAETYRFPAAARAAFDARTDYGYDYAANALTLKMALAPGLPQGFYITLIARRAGKDVRRDVFYVTTRSLDHVRGTLPVPPGFSGIVRNLGAGLLAGALFARHPSSSPSLLLSNSGEVSVAASSPLAQAGTSHTLIAQAAGRSLLGTAQISLIVTVSDRTRRGLLYHPLDAASSCESLGGGWRTPNLAEAAGLLFDGATVRVHGIGGTAWPGFSQNSQADIPLSNLAETDMHRLDLPVDSRGLDTTYTALGKRLRIRKNPVGQANVRLHSGIEGLSPHCVLPVAPDYAPPSDPAAVCFAAADGLRCSNQSNVSIAIGGRVGDAAIVTILAARGTGLSRLAAEEGFYVSLLSAQPSSLFSAAPVGRFQNGRLAVRVELLKNLPLGGTARATLRLAPKVGAAKNLIVKFSPAAVRRGLLYRPLENYSPLEDAPSCDSLGGGWRTPNLAEAAGLLFDGATVRIHGIGGTDWPGFPQNSAIDLPLSDFAETDMHRLDLPVDSRGLDTTYAALGQRLRIRKNPVGLANVRLHSGIEGLAPHCVLPAAPDYAPPSDPAGVCVATADGPRCSDDPLNFSIAKAAGRAGNFITVTIWAARGDESSSPATEAGFYLSLLSSGPSNLFSASPVGGQNGRLSVKVTLLKNLAPGENARGELRLAPKVGATTTLIVNFFRPVTFAGGLLSVNGAVNISLSESDFGDPFISPLSVQARYLGVRRGLHYVHTSEPVRSSSVFSLCAAGGTGENAWRLPYIGELAGVFSDSDSGFGTMTDSGLKRSAYDRIIYLAGARRPQPGRPGTRMEIPPKVAGDSPLALAATVASAHYADAIHSADGSPQAFHILTADDGSVQISLAFRGKNKTSGFFRAICVRPAADNYQPPPRLLETRIILSTPKNVSYNFMLFGASGFHVITARAFRYVQGDKQGEAVRENVLDQLSAELGGEWGPQFEIDVAAPHPELRVSRLSLRAKPSLLSAIMSGHRGPYYVEVRAFAPAGLTATIALTVSVFVSTGSSQPRHNAPENANPETLNPHIAAPPPPLTSRAAAPEHVKQSPKQKIKAPRAAAPAAACVAGRSTGQHMLPQQPSKQTATAPPPQNQKTKSALILASPPQGGVASLQRRRNGSRQRPH